MISSLSLPVYADSSSYPCLLCVFILGIAPISLLLSLHPFCMLVQLVIWLHHVFPAAVARYIWLWTAMLCWHPISCQNTLDESSTTSLHSKMTARPLSGEFKEPVPSERYRFIMSWSCCVAYCTLNNTIQHCLYFKRTVNELMKC